MDLIDTVTHLASRGESEPLERFNNWVKESQNVPATEITVENENFYWATISSIKFNDVVDEDLPEWFLIYSENKELTIIAKKRTSRENLIGERREPYLTTLWILKSNIDSIKLDASPVQIWTPHHFDSSIHRINYDFKQLISKLKNPKVKLTQFVKDKIWKPSTTKHIR